MTPTIELKLNIPASDPQEVMRIMQQTQLVVQGESVHPEPMYGGFVKARMDKAQFMALYESLKRSAQSIRGRSGTLERKEAYELAEVVHTCFLGRRMYSDFVCFEQTLHRQTARERKR